jgi:hypothetical protein
VNALIAMMDVAGAVRAATGWAKGLRGPEARIALLGALLCDAILGWLAWYFDISTTLAYARQIHNVVLASVTGTVLAYGPLILAIITIAPTALRQTLSGVAGRLKALAAGIILLNLFDARTDWPRVKALFDHPLAWDLFSFAQVDGSTALQGLLWGGFRLFFLFLATDVFEVLFVAMVVATILLLVNSFRGGAAATGKTTRLTP